MIFLDEAQTTEALPFDRLIDAMRALFREGCHVPARHLHEVKTPEATGTVLIMPAWTERYLGIKTVNIYPNNGQRGLPGLFSVYTLFDATTGMALAQLDGNVITARRTAAASALAASYLARPDSKRMVVVGTGRVGRLLPQAYQAVLGIEHVDVWGRSLGSAQAVCEGLAGELGSLTPIATGLDVAVSQADIVSTATLATEPLVSGNWLAPGSHLDLVGSFTPRMREADDAAFRNATIFVDTEEALEKSGELLDPLSRGVFDAADVVATLQGLCTGMHPGRSHGSERTVFKSVGTALEDLAAAILAYEYWQ
ncbi:ornithine cyclodeaminase family protein [Hydrogenophaga sp.]|uniref:ornithine cyclodeaminase family protein n=1 Tax=Hydrogenophaga sp. TaxID=1904254 RepID=UPI003F72D6F5